MSLVTRQGKGSRLTSQEMDNNLLYLQELGYSNNPIVQTYLLAKQYTPYLYFTEPTYTIPFSEYGVFIPYQEGMLLPDTGFYTIASVETSLKLAEAIYLNSNNSFKWEFAKRLFKIDSTAKSCGASVETYLKLAEAYRNLGNIKTNFNKDFVESFKNLKAFDAKTFGNYEYFDRILDKGIVEWGTIGGKSQIDTLIELTSKIVRTNPQTGVENLDRILDLGIAIIDTRKFPILTAEENPVGPRNGLLVMSVEQCNRYLESQLQDAVPV